MVTAIEWFKAYAPTTSMCMATLLLLAHDHEQRLRSRKHCLCENICYLNIYITV